MTLSEHVAYVVTEQTDSQTDPQRDAVQNNTRRRVLPAGWGRIPRTFSFVLNPFQVAVNAGVDAGFVGGSAFLAPARQTVQSPAAVRSTHERTARVALARVSTTFWIPSTDHVVRQFAAVPASLAAL